MTRWLPALALLAACAQPAAPCVQVGLAEQAFGDALQSLSLVCPECKTPQLLPSEAVDPACVFFIGPRIRVVYNRPELERIASRYGYPAIVGIFGHELGHLIDHHGGKRTDELSADMWAGCTLGIAGLPVSPLGAYLDDEGTKVDGTHPAPPKRKDAIADGAEACSQIWDD